MSFKYTRPQDLCACCLCYLEPSSFSIITTSDIHLNNIIVVKPFPGSIKLQALLSHQWPALSISFLLFFFPIAHVTLGTVLIFIYLFFIISLPPHPPLEYKLYVGKYICVCSSLLYPPGLVQNLTFSEYLNLD